MGDSDGLYDIAFEGRLVNGRKAADVERELAQHYGEGVAKKILASDRLVLKKDIDKAAAEKIQRQLYAMGLITALVSKVPPPPPPAELELSLADDYQPPSKPTENGRNTGVPAESLSLAGEQTATAKPAARARTTRSPDDLKPRPTYPLKSIDDSFHAGAEISQSVSKHYSGYMAIVAMLMVLLPLIYIAIVFAFGYLTLWHANANFDLLVGHGPRYMIIVYIVPLAGGILLTMFMLKPFIATPHDPGPQPVRLDPQREPAVFHLVERITEELGSPPPTEIQVDADVNASASLKKGMFSNELTLTIGMPLFYGMSVEQLTGVLAHEFGHFAQRAGMRVGYFIAYVNYWFYRQAYLRDSWDDLIDELGETENVFAVLTAALAQLGAWITRTLLLLLANLGTALSRGLSRQMEFDADRYEVELCGSETYARTSKMLRVLDAGHSRAFGLAVKGSEKEKFPDDLPLLGRAFARSFDKQTIQRIVASIEQVNKSVYDAHPPDLERIAAAKNLDRPGIFKNGDPAFKLLREPQRLAMHATLQMYRSHGLEIAPDELTKSEDFAREFAPKLAI